MLASLQIERTFFFNLEEIPYRVVSQERSSPMTKSLTLYLNYILCLGHFMKKDYTYITIYFNPSRVFEFERYEMYLVYLEFTGVVLKRNRCVILKSVTP